MVPRQLLVLALAVLTLHASTEATSIAPSCPRSLETLLTSAPCSGRMERLLTMSRTTIDFQDVCLDSLRALVATSPSMPCVANVNFPTSGHSHMRRLDGDNSPFKGKLNCTFDLAAPLNLSNPRQSFTMDCKEIPGPYDYMWVWVMLGVLGGPIVLWILYSLVLSGVKKIKDWRVERAQRALNRIDDMPKGLFSRFGSHA